jgi:hypothetical protein
MKKSYFAGTAHPQSPGLIRLKYTRFFPEAQQTAAEVRRESMGKSGQKMARHVYLCQKQDDSRHCYSERAK